MKRKALTNTQWERLQPLLPSQKPTTGRPASDHRVIINGIMWILRTGAPWRDLPERYGPWGTVASRFYRWRKAGLWQRLFEAIQQPADAVGKLNWAIHYVDGTIVRAGYPFSPGHYVTSITYREGLMALPGQGQLMNLR
jgi:transposase